MPYPFVRHILVFGKDGCSHFHLKGLNNLWTLADSIEYGPDIQNLTEEKFSVSLSGT